MKSWNASMSGISAISAALFDPPGSRKVRTVIPMGPNTSSRFGELSQCSTSSTSWVITYVAIEKSFRSPRRDPMTRLLLPQPGGFEGLLAIPEVLLPDDQASAQGEELKDQLVEREPAVPPVRLQPNGGEQSIAEVNDLLGIERQIRPG